jgi:predicted esterase YcpF (UPF0227 family)
MIKNVLYFHGLESLPGGEKVHYLNYEVDFVKAPAMDYTDPKVFEDWLDYVEREEPDLIIGSSMGGYFAMLLATHVEGDNNLSVSVENEMAHRVPLPIFIDGVDHFLLTQ